jgi:hypothetical protein
MIAVKRLQSVLWVLLVTLGALSAYLVSLRVGAESNELAKVRAQVSATRNDIRYLETEFSARASLRQLERWNAEDFRYSAPTATQYLEGERALAHLDGLQPNGPVYVAPPVMVAMVEKPSDLPSATQTDASSPAPAQVRSDGPDARTAPVAAAIAQIAARPSAAKSDKSPALAEARTPKGKASKDDADGAVKSARKAKGEKEARLATVAVEKPAVKSASRNVARMAMLDAKLLDDGTLGDISARAARERRKGGR